MTIVKDRILELKGQTKVTGIDFVYVSNDQLTLEVHFLLSPNALDNPLSNGLVADHIHIYNRAGVVNPAPVTSMTWINGNEVMRLTVKNPGDFTLYRLFIDDPRVDVFYNDVSFSFKANCPSDLDCAPGPHECPADELVDFPIDYTARDFWSYRQALLDFASLRYPRWKDRLAADAGVMLAEVMSALADEMAYYQDRVAREGFLETATQRRSIRRLARLVDYTPANNTGSFAWVDVHAKSGVGSFIEAGTNLWVIGDGGFRVNFEIGASLNNALRGDKYFVNPDLNTLDTYRWDENQTCLEVGATEVYLEGSHAAAFGLNQPLQKTVLLQTHPVDVSQPVRMQVVTLTGVTDMTDSVTLLPITRLQWVQQDATTFEMDLTTLKVHANLLPASSGSTFSYYMVIGISPDSLDQPSAEALATAALFEKREIIQSVEREGANKSVAYLSGLPATEASPLVWLSDGESTSSPEIAVTPMRFNGTSWVKDIPWTWMPSLVGVNSSDATSEHYTLDDGLWRRVVRYQRDGIEFIHKDYASGSGTTVRFGDGEFGLIPAEKSVFLVQYRVGEGRISNLSPGAIINFDSSLSGAILTIANPLGCTNGRDEESFTEIRQSAPYAFKEITYRAVRPEDYALAAERLPWVQHAGASLRWTGSWLTEFVTADPKGAVQLTDPLRDDLSAQLERYRQTGREAYPMDPRYADIDLEVEVCIAKGFFRGEVEARILATLFGREGIIKSNGLFSPDNFTFGTPLERSRIEATLQAITGVKAVEGIRYRRRGFFDWREFNEYYYDPGKETIIRIENDPLHPERGILKILPHGGS